MTIRHQQRYRTANKKARRLSMTPPLDPDLPILPLYATVEGESSKMKGSGFMSALAEKECVPCKGGMPPLKGQELANMANELDGGWRVIREHHLEKEYKFSNFREALEFTNKVGELAESQ